MSTAAPTVDAALAVPAHSTSYRFRRFLNWFPMGLTYAFLYMGRYNLTVSKNALGDLMTKEDFGKIFGIGTLAYFLAILVNGPLVDRMGGRKGILLAATGAGVMNLALGGYLARVLASGSVDAASLRLWFAILYAGNMYFQSAGAVSIVKVNAAWFHVRERGGFSGIFGTMISSGIFFAFSVNGWILDFFAKGSDKVHAAKWVFFAPSALLLAMAAIELGLLRDKPSEAGHQDFDTGDASSGDSADVSSFAVIKRILSHPIIVTVAFIEFCTGVLRNGVMHWYPIYVNEVLALPSTHPLNNGSWGAWWTIVPFFAVAALLFVAAYWAAGTRKGTLVAIGGTLFLVPFLQAGWGGILMVAGIVGGNVAGWVSDLFFGSRRAPAAGGLYAILFLATMIMAPVLGTPGTVVGSSKLPELRPGDRIVSVDGKDVSKWPEARHAFACVPTPCAGGAEWDGAHCICSHEAKPGTEAPSQNGTIPVVVERNGAKETLHVADPALKKDGEKLVPKLRAGDARVLTAAPALAVSPYWLGLVMFLVSLCVIGTHGLLSGTATMDFGGRRGAATAVAMIDGFVYAGTTVQSFALGYLTTRSWGYWPWFLAPFALIGFSLCTRIWSAVPRGAGGH